MKRSTALCATAFSVLIAIDASPVHAHHSYSAWAPALMTLKGTVKEYQYTSPHIWIQVLVSDPDGNQVEWSFETGSPASMKSAGWTPKLLKTGDTVTTVFHPKRDGTKEGSIVELDLPDGSVLKMHDLVLIQPGGAAATCTPAAGLPGAPPAAASGTAAAPPPCPPVAPPSRP